MIRKSFFNRYFKTFKNSRMKIYNDDLNIDENYKIIINNAIIINDEIFESNKDLYISHNMGYSLTYFYNLKKKAIIDFTSAFGVITIE